VVDNRPAPNSILGSDLAAKRAGRLHDAHRHRRHSQRSLYAGTPFDPLKTWFRSLARIAR